MKLYYFDSPGRAEVARLMFSVGGVAFEDIRFNREQWVSQYKSKSPTGQSPFLELDDGKTLCQSFAIHYYAASKSGFLPSDAEAMARIVELNMCFEDVRFRPLRRSGSREISQDC
jgi:prostaglandin-H2 D-isomerase / glutathione transferase